MLERYNFIIKSTKICLIGLVALCIIIIGLNYLSTRAIDIVLSKLPSAPTIISKSDATVSNPVFTGSGTNSYKISAEKITKNIDGLYYMHNISGIYNLDNSQNITITASIGSINNYEDIIIMNNNVKIGYEDYALLSEKLEFYLKSKSAKSNVFVQIKGHNGSINADRFTTTEKFGEITFDGNVEANFNVNINN